MKPAFFIHEDKNIIYPKEDGQEWLSFRAYARDSTDSLSVFTLIADAYAWCHGRFEPECWMRYDDFRIIFLHETNAIEFKLRWVG